MSTDYPLPAGWRHATLDEFLVESRAPGGTGATAEKLTIKLYGGGVHAKSDRGQGSENTKYFRRSAGQFIYSKLDFLNGAFALVPPELDGRESTADLPSFDIRDGIAPEWLLYFVGRPAFYQRQGGAAIGSRKARRVGPEEFFRIPIPLPPLAEQKKIAAILSSVDEAIRANEAVIEQTRRVKEGLLQELLTRGIGHTEFRETEIGPLPVGWEVVTLATISELVTSGPRGWAQYYSETGPLFIRSQNIRSGTLDLTDVVRVAPPADAEADRSRLATDDILITITGNSVGNVGRVGPNEEGSYASQHVGVVRLLDRSLASFVMAFIAPGGPGNSALMGNAYGQSKPGLNLQQLRSLMVPLPESHERSRIDEIIRSHDESLAAQFAQREVLGTLKSGLLQDLLTGKVRVSP